ncbi:MAG: FAD-binding domain-containing protein [Candidatus Delongbacteria bacterium]
MTLVWLTHSLRRHDNPALAVARDEPALLILDPAPPLPERSGAWRARSLRLFLAEAEAAGRPVLDARRLDAAAWDALRGLDPRREVQLDLGDPAAAAAARTRLVVAGLTPILHEPGLCPQPELLIGPAGRLPRSFSAFQRLFVSRVEISAPRPEPDQHPWLGALPAELANYRLRLADLPAAPALPAGNWQPGEAAALARLQAFREADWPADPAAWERADGGGSSFLSPWLARGELGPRTVWQALDEEARDPARAARARSLQRQLIWREYALALLREHPDLAWEPVAPAWRDFPRRPDAARLAAWRAGRTGIPIVDAAQRQLYAEGWIHNRLRMMTGTWLVKQLGQPWTDGLKVFEEWLVDWDPALNAMNWQWCAGCGVDAQPWFRLFSPERQAERADPDGRLLRRWLPELNSLSLETARRAWTLTPLERAATGYPAAQPDPVQGRQEALAAWERFRARP